MLTRVHDQHARDEVQGAHAIAMRAYVQRMERHEHNRQDDGIPCDRHYLRTPPPVSPGWPPPKKFTAPALLSPHPKNTHGARAMKIYPVQEFACGGCGNYLDVQRRPLVGVPIRLEVRCRAPHCDYYGRVGVVEVAAVEVDVKEDAA